MIRAPAELIKIGFCLSTRMKVLNDEDLAIARTQEYNDIQFRFVKGNV